MGEEQFSRDPFAVSAYIVSKPIMKQLLSSIIRIEFDEKKNKYYDANIIASYPKPCIPSGCCCSAQDAMKSICKSQNNTYHSTGGWGGATTAEQYPYCVMSPHGITLPNYLYGLLNRKLYRSTLPLFVSALDKNVSYFVGKNYTHFYGGSNELAEFSAGKLATLYIAYSISRLSIYCLPGIVKQRSIMNAIYNDPNHNPPYIQAACKVF